MLAKQPKEYNRGRLDEDDNDSLVDHENPTRQTSSTQFRMNVNTDDYDKFLRDDGEGIWIEHRGNEK